MVSPCMSGRHGTQVEHIPLCWEPYKRLWRLQWFLWPMHPCHQRHDSPKRTFHQDWDISGPELRKLFSHLHEKRIHIPSQRLSSIDSQRLLECAQASFCLGTQTMSLATSLFPEVFLPGENAPYLANAPVLMLPHKFGATSELCLPKNEPLTVLHSEVNTSGGSGWMREGGGLMGPCGDQSPH